MLLQHGGCLVDPPGDVSRAHLQVEGHVVEAPHARVHVGAEGADCALHVWEKTENIIVALTSTNKHSIYKFTMHYFISFFIYRVNYTTYVKKIKKKKNLNKEKRLCQGPLTVPCTARHRLYIIRNVLELIPRVPRRLRQVVALHGREETQLLREGELRGGSVSVVVVIISINSDAFVLGLLLSLSLL